jgi:hypothetical protein
MDCIPEEFRYLTFMTLSSHTIWAAGNPKYLLEIPLRALGLSE